MNCYVKLLLGFVFSLTMSGLAAGSEPAPAPQPASETAAKTTVWSAWGGEIEFVWFRDLAQTYGFSVSAPLLKSSTGPLGEERLEVRGLTQLSLGVRDGAFDGFRGGSLTVRGGFDLKLADGSIPLREFTLRPRASNPFILDVVAGDGVAWFYIDRLMYEFKGGPPRLSVEAMDLRISEKLALRLGDPLIAGHVIAGMAMLTHVHTPDFVLPPQLKGGPDSCASGRWHGCLGAEADVFMETFSVQFRRDSADADGPGGTDGRVVYTPSSTLRNNRNDGSRVCTVGGGTFPTCTDPLGASTALVSAWVPWFQKFTGNFQPHDNDQHPYLIWNLYRTDADGRITQVGRSGVKHAFLTTNTGCAEPPPNSHVLTRGCGDTYGVGNNDSTGDLGPRREIIPATGQWGRCGSVYDADCNGSSDAGAPCNGVAECATFFNRMAVRESMIDPVANSGAQWWFESWYIVRDDVNIYNTMQTRPVSFNWTGSAWAITNASPLLLGPAIDRFMPRGTNTASQRSSDILRPEGQGRVAANVIDLGGGLYRYDYAVMNFDFAEAVTSGSEPNLRVISNDGFTRLELAIPAGADISAVQFDDGDIDAGNDWTVSQTADSLSWTAGAGAALNWGTLFHFSFVADVPPTSSQLRLVTAQQGSPDFVDVDTLGPSPAGAGGFSVGGMASGVNGSDGVDLSLNGSETITVSNDGAFLFSTALADNDPFQVTVARQPTGRDCSITGGSGVIAGDDELDVQVDCVVVPPDQVNIGGNVSGLASGRSVGLSLNGGSTYSVGANGSFQFPNTLAVGVAYAVTVSSNPPAQQCTVTNGSGTAPAGGVSNVLVSCADLPPTFHSVRFTLTNLQPSTQITLQLNGGSNLNLTSDGQYVFGTLLQSGTDYAVTVLTQPAGQNCVVSNGTGTIISSNVDNVGVNCTALPPTYTVGGTVSGLLPGQSVTLMLNGSESLTRSSNGAFVFATTLADTAPYLVSIGGISGEIECAMENGGGTIAGANVSNVAVTCSALWQRFQDGFESPDPGL